MTEHQSKTPTIWQRLVEAWQQPGARSLPADSNFRKEIPVDSANYRYFPAAVVAKAAWSKVANDKHNPGQPVHWARGKSMDHNDCVARHSIDLADMQAAEERGAGDPNATLAAMLEEATCRAWRADAELQLLCERIGAPLAPAARLPDPVQEVTPDPAPAQKWGVYFGSSEDARSTILPQDFDSEEAAKEAVNNSRSLQYAKRNYGNTYFVRLVGGGK